MQSNTIPGLLGRPPRQYSRGDRRPAVSPGWVSPMPPVALVLPTLLGPMAMLVSEATTTADPGATVIYRRGEI